jgi:hypothetical protein
MRSCQTLCSRFPCRAGRSHDPDVGARAGGQHLIAGRIDAVINTTGSLLQAARGGQVRGAGAERGPALAAGAGLSHLAESGVPEFDVSSCYVLLAPARTSAEIMRRIGADMASTGREPQPLSRNVARLRPRCRAIQGPCRAGLLYRPSVALPTCKFSVCGSFDHLVGGRQEVLKTKLNLVSL